MIQEKEVQLPLFKLLGLPWPGWVKIYTSISHSNFFWTGVGIPQCVVLWKIYQNISEILLFSLARFPLIPTVLPCILGLSERWKVQPDGPPTACGLGEKLGRRVRNEWMVSPHSGSFLPSHSSSHTFLVEWGELSAVWSGCYIPVANTCPLIIVIKEPCQVLWQCRVGGWMHCHSHRLLSKPCLHKKYLLCWNKKEVTLFCCCNMTLKCAAPLCFSIKRQPGHRGAL